VVKEFKFFCIDPVTFASKVNDHTLRDLRDMVNEREQEGHKEALDSLVGGVQNGVQEADTATGRRGYAHRYLVPPYEKYVDDPESHEAVRRAHDDEQLKREAKIQLFTKAPEEMRGQYFEVSQEAYELFRSEAKMVRESTLPVCASAEHIYLHLGGRDGKMSLRCYGVTTHRNSALSRETHSRESYGTTVCKSPAAQ